MKGKSNPGNRTEKERRWLEAFLRRKGRKCVPERFFRRIYRQQVINESGTASNYARLLRKPEAGCIFSRLSMILRRHMTAVFRRKCGILP